MSYPVGKYKPRKKLKRKAVFSKQAKKALLIACYEARNYQTYVNLDFLLYGLLTQPNCLSNRLFLLAISQFRNNENITTQALKNRIQKIHRENFSANQLNKLSNELLNENRKTPWLTSELKELIRSAIRSSFQTRRKIAIVTTKQLFFELLNNENIRTLLRSLVE